MAALGPESPIPLDLDALELDLADTLAAAELIAAQARSILAIDLGAGVRMLRQEAGLSLDAVAAELGVAVRTLTRIEASRWHPRLGEVVEAIVRLDRAA